MKFYTEKWREAELAEQKGLPKSALKIVDEINAQAKKDKLSEQVIKSYIFRLKYKNSFEENAFEKLIFELDSTVQTADFPDNAVMHSMLADMYWQYYQNNRWKFLNRSNTVNFDNQDMQTWTLDFLVSKVIKEYDAALANAPALQKIPIKQYKELIRFGTKPSNLRPTLYDFLAHKAVDFYAGTEVSLTRPADYFQLKEDFYFADIEDFVKHEIYSSDTLSLHFQAQCVIQDLLKFRLSHPDESDALFDADMKRIRFAYKHSVNNNKNDLYLNALKNLHEKYPGKYAKSESELALARYYYNLASKYDPLSKETNKYKNAKTTALNYIENILKNYPKTNAAEHAESLKIQIKSRILNFTCEETIASNQVFSTLISYQNTETVYVQIGTISEKKYKDITEHKYGFEAYQKIRNSVKTVYDKTVNLPIDKDYNKHTTEYLFDGLPKGFYVLFMSDNEKFTYKKGQASYQVLRVSDIAYMKQKQPDGSYKFTLTDRTSGVPIRDVKCNIWHTKYNYTLSKYQRIEDGTKRTDENGQFILPLKKKHSVSYYVDFHRGDDFLSTASSIYMYPRGGAAPAVYRNFLFTDRAIYRPGQTVYFKGIKLLSEVDKNEVARNSGVQVVFYDVNMQEVSKLNLTTNKYGTFSGSFDIPTGLLNGQFTIFTGYGSKTIRVEEYKRPKFEVSLDKFNGNYLLNDDIKVKGKAVSYSGASLSDADVKYRITRTPRWRGWWYWSPPVSTIEIANGTVKTNDKGEYEFDFKAVPDLSLPENEFTYFAYNIKIDVTDINGETQSTAGNINVGYRALQVSLPLSGILDKADPKYLNDKQNEIIIGTNNYNAEFIPASGVIKIFKLKDNEQALRNRLWTRPDKHLYTKEEWQQKFSGNVYDDENKIQNLQKDKEVFEEIFNTGKIKKLSTKFISSLETGHYVVEISSEDAFGNPVENKHFFSVADSESDKIPYHTLDFFTNIKTLCEPGDTASWLIGTSDEITVLYEIEHKDKIVHSEYIKLNNEQKRIELPIEEKHRGNVSVSFSYIKNNRFYNHASVVYVPHSDKKLDIEFLSFRDKLYPGQKEQWKIKIKGAKGEKVAAEMLATLYDASLDKFAVNNWNFNIYKSYYKQYNWNTNTFGQSVSSTLKEGIDVMYYAPKLYYDKFNWFGFTYWGNYYGHGDVLATSGGRRRTLSVMTPKSAPKYKKEASKNDDFEADAEEIAEDKNIAEKPLSVNTPAPEPEENFEEVKVRTNFNETAFFYPHLETDADGNITISFTVPESLTKWKMMGFAVTEDLKYGFINNELVTQKDLMVVPNSPRFFRENDKIRFPVKISNISEKDLSGNIKLELSDAFTMKPVEHIFAKNEQKTKTFTVKAGSNSVVFWDLEIPDGAGVIAYKVVAKAGEFSDGEQKPIPVLTNRMLVTESMPLPIRGKETKNFEFTKLINSGKSSTLRHHKLTLEYTSNPAWYAVQALPYMIEYPYECTEQTFSRYYANSLASNIANSSPKIKAVFDSWKNTPDSKALISNLEKNQELKALLLEETPWVMQGKDETERKKRIGVLFDLNRMGNEMGKALTKIQKAQKANGAWPWFEGMPESRYITQYLVTGFGRLDKLGVKEVRNDKKTWNMLNKAVGYLDKQIAKDYKWLKRNYSKKEMAENHLSSTAVYYLYGRSYFTDIEIPASSKTAVEYYQSQARKYWLSQSKYMQGMLALELHRFGDEKTPKDIMKSLKEFSTSDEELGMYWKDNVGGYYWYQAPIETQALMIEAFDEVMNDTAAVYDLKIWLLKQKQTQDWKTTRATAEAVYALLRRGGNWLASDKLVEIKMNGKIIDPKKSDNVKIEAGTGYFKTSWSGDEIKPKMGKITITKTDEGIAWGALYWQYFEQLDKITPHETPLKLKKQLFIERNTDRGIVIEPISETAKLHVGDKVIVRIELRADRRMEYIHMKDMRAGGFEPINVISRYKRQDGLGYYESTKDAATNFFMESLPKGTFVFEYPLRVTHEGDFSNGVTTIQCMYAPEFTAHSEGIRVNVVEK